jgi:hypothetical protein
MHEARKIADVAATRIVLGPGDAATRGCDIRAYSARHESPTGTASWKSLLSPQRALTIEGGIAFSARCAHRQRDAQRHGRNRVVMGAMFTAVALSLEAGWTTGGSAALAIAAVFHVEHGHLHR